jgi:guanine deaminase
MIVKGVEERVEDSGTVEPVNRESGQQAARSQIRAIRGPVLTFTGDPFLGGVAGGVHHEPDGLLLIANGRILAFGPHGHLRHSLPPGTPVTTYGSDCLILPGFIDTHVHYPQIQIIGAPAGQLIEWLEQHAFRVEQRFNDKEHARATARVFLAACLRAGTTTAAVYCTVHPESVDAFFEEAERFNLRMIAGKVMMDRHAPAALTDTAARGFDESRALIARWHGRGRLLYGVTLRFAPTSTPEQLEAAGRLWRATPGAYLMSHVSENRDEVAWVRRLYPDRSGYLDVYDHYGLLGPRAIYGHGIWLTEDELRRCHDTSTAIAHCPTANLFLGSGLFKLTDAKRAGRPVRVGLGTDLGAGTSFSPLVTMNEAYKVARLSGGSLNALEAFYLATRGGAQALCLDDTIGTIAPGFEADLVVLDLHSTPAIAYRMQRCRDLVEALFIQMTLGDDRAVLGTYVAGEQVYTRGSGGNPGRGVH